MVFRRYFTIGLKDPDENSCKIPIVQNKVAFIIGYKITLGALPCFLTVLFYIYRSNSWGRRFVILFQISGRLLAVGWIVIIGCFDANVSPKLIWISSLFLFIGGGREAQVSMVYTSFCDVIPEEKRTQLLSLAHASEGLAGILAYPVGSMLMAYRVWAPFVLAIVIIVSEYVVLWYIPEISPFFTDSGAAHPAPSSTQDRPSATEHWWETSAAQVRSSSLWALFKHRGLSIIFAAFFIKRTAFSGENFISHLESCMLLALSVLIPALTGHLKSPVKDLRVISGSLISVITGFSVLWLGRSVPVLCLGLMACGLAEGLDVGLQSIGAYIVGEAHYGTFFALSSMLGVAGELVGGPLMAAMYAVRGKSGGPLGYCFLLSTILFACLLLASRFINTNRLLD